jgi:hypothetical protein
VSDLVTVRFTAKIFKKAKGEGCSQSHIGVVGFAEVTTNWKN